MLAGRGILASGLMAFNPTYNVARTSDTGGSYPGWALRADARDAEVWPTVSSATIRGKIWVQTTASDTVVYCAITDRTGNTITAVYYDTSGASLGDPGTTSSQVMALGLRVDSLSIAASVITSSGDGTSSAQIGSYTDSAFFNPTNAVQYGFYGHSSSADNEVPDIDSIDIQVTFTFRKTGYEDLIVAYKAMVDTRVNPIT